MVRRKRTTLIISSSEDDYDELFQDDISDTRKPNQRLPPSRIRRKAKPVSPSIQPLVLQAASADMILGDPQNKNNVIFQFDDFHPETIVILLNVKLMVNFYRKI